jgi:hypothetical protein
MAAALEELDLIQCVVAFSLLPLAGFFAGPSDGHPGPRIVPVRYGLDKSRRRYGLVIVNEGATAYNVCIPNYSVRIGAELLVFGSGLAWLSSKTEEATIDSWTEER